MNRIKVSLGKRSYYIYIGYNVLPKLGKMLGDIGLRGKGAIITDNNVKKIWADSLQKGLPNPLPIYSITPGEGSKSLDTAKDIYTQLLKWGLDRYSFLIALGGGVVGDLTGFVAATYMRGILYVQVPTTLMAQVDSSIGGKTAVNLSEGKNLVGCFWQPQMVFTDIKTLSTLPKEEFKAGLSEVVKYGVIRDEKLFEILEKRSSELFSVKKDLWEPLVARCSKIKADITIRDERETKGLRPILNYGHTIGHALEADTGYKKITHGEAVAFGMLKAARLSHRLGYLSQKDMDRQINLIKKLGLTLQNKTVLFCKVIKRMRYDKKAKEGKLRFVLAKKIGEVFVADNVDEKDVSAVLSK